MVGGVGTGGQLTLPPTADNLVHEYVATPSTEGGLAESCGSTCGIAELPAHHYGIVTAPTIITDRPPQSIDADLHSSLVEAAASDQTDISTRALTPC